MTENDSWRLECIDESTREAVQMQKLTKSALDEWRDNQTWQINDLRKRLDNGLRAGNTWLAMIFGALCYIGYKLQ